MTVDSRRWSLLASLTYLALPEGACFGAASSGCCWLFLVETDLVPARCRVLLLLAAVYCCPFLEETYLALLETVGFLALVGAVAAGSYWWRRIQH